MRTTGVAGVVPGVSDDILLGLGIGAFSIGFVDQQLGNIEFIGKNPMLLHAVKGVGSYFLMTSKNQMAQGAGYSIFASAIAGLGESINLGGGTGDETARRIYGQQRYPSPGVQGRKHLMA